MPKEYASNDPNNPNGRGLSRRRLLRAAGAVAGGIATATGVYGFFHDVLPAIGNAIGSIPSPDVHLPELPTNLPEWTKTPIKRVSVSTNGGEYIYTLPARTLACYFRKDSSVTAPQYVGTLYIDFSDDDRDKTVAVSFPDTSTSIEIYKPDESPVDSWHALLLKKKQDLITTYGKDNSAVVMVHLNTIALLNQYYRHISDIS